MDISSITTTNAKEWMISVSNTTTVSALNAIRNISYTTIFASLTLQDALNITEKTASSAELDTSRSMENASNTKPQDFISKDKMTNTTS